MTKCVHGMYDVSVCAYCLGTAAPVAHMMADNSLIKDVAWHGIGVPQRESTQPWNAVPKLETADEIWARTDKALAEKEYTAYREDTDPFDNEAAIDVTNLSEQAAFMQAWRDRQNEDYDLERGANAP